MKDMKKTISAITLVIVGLVITSSVTALTYQPPSIEDNDNLISVVQNQPIMLTKVDNSVKSLGGKQVTSGTYDEYHPSVAASPAGGYFAMLQESQDGATWIPALYGSDAAGEVWQGLFTFPYNDAQYTAADSNAFGSYSTFGAPPLQNSLAVVFQCEDPVNNGWAWDWGSVGEGFSNLYYNDIACYDDPEPNATQMGWNLALVGSYGTSNHGVPMVMYMEWGPNNYGLMSRSSRTGYLHAANSCDNQKLLTYNVFDHTDGDHLFVRVVNVGKWYWNSAQQYWSHQDKKSLEISETEFQVQYPSVAAYNNSAIIVAQKINGSVNDIICYYSDNGFTSYNRTMIADSGDDETYPQVIMTGQKTGVCTYVRNNVLYYKQTIDGGATWSVETQVSDNQVRTEYRTEGLCSKLGNTYAVWADTRGANADIYFDLVCEGPKIPLIKIGAITAGFGKITAEINNIGTGPATNVEWSIKLDGGFIFLGKETIGTPIASIEASGQSVVSSAFIFGIGGILRPLTITVHAKCAEGSEDTKVVGGSVFFVFVKIK